jgi:hypothetical protein
MTCSLCGACDCEPHASECPQRKPAEYTPYRTYFCGKYSNWGKRPCPDCGDPGSGNFCGKCATKRPENKPSKEEIDVVKVLVEEEPEIKPVLLCESDGDPDRVFLTRAGAQRLFKQTYSKAEINQRIPAIIDWIAAHVDAEREQSLRERENLRRRFLSGARE